ncbi:MAG TPA: LCP family protein [Anaerolineales bacterium]|nr:LCP family protein [Anaerolineales bacterium]
MYTPSIEDTRPSFRGPAEETPIEAAETRPRRRPRRRSGALFLGLVLGVSAAVYFLSPIRTNVLVLGTDRRPGEGPTARSDSLILTTVIPTVPYVGMLSIPRDLWVEVPGAGPNRINTAYFLAEAQQPGTGAAAAVETVRTNFGVDVNAYVVIEFTGFVRFVDALGGVTIELDRPMGGYPAGKHHLDGTQALAFARDRKDGDDFFRMEHGQILVRSLLRTVVSPLTWPRWPLALPALLTAVRTDLSPLEWPRLALAVLRAGPSRIDSRAIGRDMVQGFRTDAGAQVLAPDWSRINPVLLEMFGQ